MAKEESEGESGDTCRGAGHPDVESDELAYVVGELLIELGTKIQRAGVTGVRIVTEDEAQETQLRWFREGWDEHARAADPERSGPPGHPDVESPAPPEPPESPAGRLLQFRTPGTHPLPLVGTDNARARERDRDLMPHRPRRRRDDEPGAER
ncbi:hypothetical protein [Streptomyces sp. NBC_01304]|uniref:hypothetical protein n=1 Tax=Streptomyces sp. NBC_01304 TaxID=2903818 RepID=UPI002E119722|nr:hypothetical protein OG430_23865 [Streptomyces sp. NBC_01304]